MNEEYENYAEKSDYMLIGLTGPLGSGKDTVKNILEKKLSYKSIRLSAIVEEEIRRRKLPFTRENYQNVGDDLRKKYGAHILVKRALEKLGSCCGIINGIRNPAEVEYLREKCKNFILISINANRKVRYERLKKRGKRGDPKTWEEFVKKDDRELGINEPEYGLRIKDCMKMADIAIINEGSKEELEREVEYLCKQLY